MAGSINKVTLVGNLGKDPEVRAAQSGFKVVTLAIATSETWNDKATNERQERTEWHRVVIMNEKLAEVAEKYLKKGAKIYIEGKLQTRKWTDQTGIERYTTEVVIGRFGGELVLLDSRASATGNWSDSKASGPIPENVDESKLGKPAKAEGWEPSPVGAGIEEDDIPF